MMIIIYHLNNLTHIYYFVKGKGSIFPLSTSTTTVLTYFQHTTNFNYITTTISELLNTNANIFYIYNQPCIYANDNMANYISSLK